MVAGAPTAVSAKEDQEEAYVLNQYAVLKLINLMLVRISERIKSLKNFWQHLSFWRNIVSVFVGSVSDEVI